jgi:hypothetical protein
MVFVGFLLALSAVAVLVAVAARRGASAVQTVILILTALIAIPAAMFGVIILGFSGSAEETRTGAVLLVGSLIAGGGIAFACISKLKRLNADRT